MKVIFELGTSYCKIGIAGEAQPRHFIKTNAKFSKMMQSFEYTVNFEELFCELFTMCLHKICVAQPTQVLVIHTIYCPGEIELRHAMHHALSAKLNIQQVEFAYAQDCALLAACTDHLHVISGLVIDIGEYETRLIAYCHGKCILLAMQFVPVGVAHLKQELMRWVALQEEDAEEALIRVCYCKEQVQGARNTTAATPTKPVWPLYNSAKAKFVPLSSKQPSITTIQSIKKKRKMVKYKHVEFSDQARYSCMEPLFDPICAAMQTVFAQLDTETRAHVCGNVIVTGGGCMLVGILKRLATQCNTLIQYKLRWKKNAIFAWQGASLMGTLP